MLKLKVIKLVICSQHDVERLQEYLPTIRLRWNKSSETLHEPYKKNDWKFKWQFFQDFFGSAYALEHENEHLRRGRFITLVVSQPPLNGLA